MGRELHYNIHPSDRLGFSTQSQKGQIEENGRRSPRILPSFDTFCTCHMTYSFVKDRRDPWAAPHISLCHPPITHNRFMDATTSRLINCGSHPPPPVRPTTMPLPGWLALARRHGTGWGVSRVVRALGEQPVRFDVQWCVVWSSRAERGWSSFPRACQLCVSRYTGVAVVLCCPVPRYLLPDIGTFSFKLPLVNTFRLSKFSSSFSLWLRIRLACSSESRCGDCLPKWIPPERKKKERKREAPALFYYL